MTPNAILPVAFLSVLSLGCQSSSPAESTSPSASPGGDARSAGHEHGFAHPHTYADRLDDPKRDAWQKPAEVVDLLDCVPGAVAADLGAGTGYFLSYLAEAVGPEGQVVALDVSQEMVDRMTDRIRREGIVNARAELVPADDPGLPPASVDRVLIVNTWHHIVERVDYAKKLRAALRPGGRVLVVDFTKQSPHGPPASMRLTLDTVRAELEAAGLRANHVQAPLPYQYVVEGRLPR